MKEFKGIESFFYSSPLHKDFICDDVVIENKAKPRNVLFLSIVFLCSPIWVVFLILMLCYDIANNFRDQINAGYKPLIR